MPRPLSAALRRRIEAMGVRSTKAHWSLMPPDLARRLRARVLEVGDALLTIAGGSDALRMNQVTGLGHRAEVGRAAIDEIIGHYRAARVRRFSVMLDPGPRAETIASRLRARGFARRPGHELLVRDARIPVSARPAGVRIVRARRLDVDAVIAVHEGCFAEPAGRRAWTRAGILSGGNEHYLAFVDSQPVAAGALRIDGDLAWLGMGATLTRWRRRGAHRALIAARLRRAARQGCRLVWVETAAFLPGRPSGSRRNLLRMGFEEAGERPRYVWCVRR